MKNSKHTKRAFLASILSMLLCMAMLIGSTFAWFTDSVTSGKNIIKAGNLDIFATYQNVDMQNGTAEYTISGFDRVAGGTVKFAAATTDINKDNAMITENIWEPGAVGAKLITVTNSGNLAAKIKLNFAVNDGGLQDALWFDFVKVENGVVTGQFTEREMNTLTAFSSATELPLASGSNISFILLYGMKEEAGNEYMGKSFEADVTILATQDTVESDSFGKDYDAGAEYPVVTQSDFEEALNQVKPGDDLKLSAGKFKMMEGNYEIPEGVSIIGEKGTEIWVEHGTTASSSGLLLAGNNVTLSNVKLVSTKYSQNNYTGFVKITGNNVVLDNVTLNANSMEYASPIVISSTSADNVITIKNCNISSKKARAIYIVDGANGAVNIENCNVTGVYPISVNSASSQELVLNVTGSKLNGWTSYGAIKSANFTDTVFGKGGGYQFIRPYADTTFTNCTFEEEFLIGAGATGKTYTINNCIANGVKLTAENVESQLLDMTGDDGTKLKGCTIVVDGVSMTPGATVEP